MQNRYDFLTYYDSNHLSKLFDKFKKVRGRVILYLACDIAFISLIIFIIYGFSAKQNQELGFYFYTSIIVLLIIALNLCFTWFNLNRSQLSLNVIQRNTDAISDYLFKQNGCFENKSVIGVSNRNTIFVISINSEQKFYTIFGFGNGLHKSGVNLLPFQLNVFEKALDNPKYFLEINENW